MTKIKRVIDANVNRASEGLRVVEDVCRFILDNDNLTRRLKDIRHRLRDSSCLWSTETDKLCKSRDAKSDVGRYSNTESEIKRNDVFDIVSANLKRTEEAIRVLEEFTKLKDINVALTFQEDRYNLYEIEKEILAALDDK